MAESSIDFTRIEFPSDRLTVKVLRQKFPEVFDRPPRDGSRLWRRPTQQENNDLETLVGGILNTERELAARAFYAATGKELPSHDRGAGYRDEAAECLGNDYMRYGLARGRHEAAEMIRHIEAQATSQAQLHLGRGS